MCEPCRCISGNKLSTFPSLDRPFPTSRGRGSHVTAIVAICHPFVPSSGVINTATLLSRSLFKRRIAGTTKGAAPGVHVCVVCLSDIKSSPRKHSQASVSRHLFLTPFRGPISSRLITCQQATVYTRDRPCPVSPPRLQRVHCRWLCSIIWSMIVRRQVDRSIASSFWPSYSLLITDFPIDTDIESARH